MENNCLLGKAYCLGNCRKCGWNPEEAKRRNQMVADGKLTICKDGLKRLIINREVSEE